MPQQTCSKCASIIDANAKFCPYCGQATAAYGGPCPYCGHAVAANAKFCPNCGRQMGGQKAPDAQGNVWRKSPDEFAARVQPADLKGLFAKEIEVQPGQQVLLLVDGSADATRKGPGRYTVDSLFEKLLTLGAAPHITALVVDGGYTTLEFVLPKLYTREDYEVTARCVLGVSVENAVAFFANVMKSGRSVSLADLRSYLFDEVRDAVQDVVSQTDLRSLVTGLRLKNQMAVAVEQHLQRTLVNSGLALGGVHTVEVQHPRLDALRRQSEEIELARREAEANTTQERDRLVAEVQKRHALWEIQLEKEDQETAEDRARARLYEERAEVYDQIRRAVMTDQVNTVKTEEEYKDFLAGIDKRKTLRQEELDTLAEDFASRKDDRAKARAHAAYLAELERDYNRKQAELVWKTDFTLAQMADSLKVQQQQLADEGLLDERRWQNDLAGLGRQSGRTEWDRVELQKKEVFDRQRAKDGQAHRLDLDKAETLHKLEMRAIQTDSDLTDIEKRKRSEVAQARFEAERQDIVRAIQKANFDEQLRQQRLQDAAEREADSADLDLGLRGLREMKAIKREDQQGTLEIQRRDKIELEKHALEVELARKEAERQAKAMDQAHELALLQARGELSAEALMSLSGADQARAIADLRKTDAMKGMTDEQVYALMAAQSPAVAQALTERFKAMAARPQELDAQTRALYERMLTDAQKDREKDAELKERTEERFQQILEKTLESQRTGMVEIARAMSGQGSQSGPVIVMNPGTGQPQVIQTSGGAVQSTGGTPNKVQVCPRCRIETAVGTKFCTNCGWDFFEVKG